MSTFGVSVKTPFRRAVDLGLGRLGRSRLTKRVRAHPAIAAGIAIAAGTAIARPASYQMPLERDTAQMLYGGQVLLHGGAPYADAAVNKGPLTYVLFALVRLVSGRSETLVRLTLLAFAVITALALAAYLRRTTTARIGLMGGMAMGLLSAIAPFMGDDPNNLQYAVAPMVGAWWLASREDMRSAVLSGVLVAIAALINPACLAVAPVIALQLWWSATTDGPKRLAGAGVGTVMVAAPVAVWLGYAGALDDLMDQVPGTWHGAEIAAGPSLLDVRRLLEVPAPALWVASLASCGLTVLACPRLRRPAALATAWIVCWWARVKLGDYWAADTEKPHHYYPALPGLVTGLVVGIGALTSWRGWRPAAWAWVMLALPFCAYVARPQLQSLKVPGYARWGPGSSWSEAYDVASFVRSHTAAGSTLLAAGSDPEVNWLANRLAPTRFFDIFPIDAHPAYGSERHQELLRRPPEAIVALANAPVDSDLNSVLATKHYRLVANLHGSRVWLRGPSG